MKEEALLFALLRHTVCGQPLKEDVTDSLTPELLSSVYVLSQKHDLAHIVGHGLTKLGALGEDPVSQKLKKTAMQAVYRYMQMDYAYAQLCGGLEAAGLPFLPLKGSVLRTHYPEAWMRTSCDIDLLVKEENVKPVIDCLTDKLQYQYKGRYLCEHSLYSPNGIHLEVHSDAEIMQSNEAQMQVLHNLWSAVSPEDGCIWKLAMPDAQFYYYHIQHMAKHFSSGGCGVRSFLDIWILNHRMDHDREKRELLLKAGGLLPFARAAEKLSEVWFAGEAGDELTAGMADYVLGAGIYGSMENMVANRQSRKGGKLGYILSRLFVPYAVLKKGYPILERHKWLLPVYQVVRWVKMLVTGRAKRSAEELRLNASMDGEKVKKTAELMRRLEL